MSRLIDLKYDISRLEDLEFLDWDNLNMKFIDWQNYNVLIGIIKFLEFLARETEIWNFWNV